ncbi:DUF4468 domain-containing protein, partial [Klebsiella variicola]|uniref:DUF4468 domain-containing protein n=1 Tax=Klebsiella variicola TaxID=244366 RepID=UPI00358EEDE8
FSLAENTDDLFVGKSLLHGDVLMWLMKTLLTSRCINQRGAGHSSKIWVAKAFTDSNSVIQYADKEEGSIVGKGNVKYPCDGFNDCLANEDVRYKFTMKIDTKDDKARITFDDIHIYRPAHVTSGIAFPAIDSPNMTVGGQAKAKKALNDIVEQYKREIVTESSSAAKDW